MKKQQPIHGALRARTRAFLCAITLALLCFTAPAKAQDWGTEATSGAGVNVSVAFANVTMNVTTVGATKRVQLKASDGNTAYLALIVDGSLSISSIDDIPVGTYTIANTGAVGTALASQGLSGLDIIGTGGISSGKYLHATGGTVYVFETHAGDHKMIYLRATEFHQPSMNNASGNVQAAFVPSGMYYQYMYANTLTSCGSGSAAQTGGMANIFSWDYEITATPTGSASFVEWRDGDGNFISTDNPYTFVAWGPDEVVAVFSDGIGCPSAAPVTPTYDVVCTVSPVGAGTVTGADTYDEGDDVTLTATPANRRYQFVRWTESASEVGTETSYTINDIAANHTLVAEFEEIPVTLADNEETAYYSTTLSTFTGSMDFQLMRTFFAGMWNTVCFPFALSSSQIAASDMSGATFYTLTSVTGDAAEGLDFNVSEVTSLSARTPYLVQVTGSDIENPVFAGVTLDANAFTNNTSGTNVGATSFFGTVHPTDLAIGENSGFLFLGQNNTLYWPNVANKIRAFRAYFYSGDGVVQSVHPRARIVVQSETATGVEETDATRGADGSSAKKYLRNGSLVIERDGVKYNAVGQVISE